MRRWPYLRNSSGVMLKLAAIHSGTIPLRHARACPGHPRLRPEGKSWMAGTSPAITMKRADCDPGRLSLRREAGGVDRGPLSRDHVGEHARGAVGHGPAHVALARVQIEIPVLGRPDPR